MSKSAVIETQSGKPSRLSKLYEKAVIGQLGRIQKGCIHLHTAGEVYELGDPSADLSISLTVYDRRFLKLSFKAAASALLNHTCRVTGIAVI